MTRWCPHLYSTRAFFLHCSTLRTRDTVRYEQSSERSTRILLNSYPVWSKYSNAQRFSSLHLFQRLLESAIVVGYVFQFSGRSRDGLEDHAELSR